MTTLYNKTQQNQTSFGVVPPEFNLTKQDIESLKLCGIPIELQQKYCRRVTDEQGAEIVGQQRKAGREFGGLVFAIYTQPNHTQPNEYELRRDIPDFEIVDGIKKEKAKYLRHSGRGGLLAIPKNISAEELNDISIPLVVCEGMKKFLAAEWLATHNLAPGEKRRFIPVAVSGVWNWRGKVGKASDSNGVKHELKGLITGFHNINLKHRPLNIVFDNDTHTNYKVRFARHQFAETLEVETSAIVYLTDLPKSDKKIGFDDYLGKLQKDFGKDAAMVKGLEFLETKYRFSNELQSKLLNGKITLSIAGADRGKCKLSVKNSDGETMAMDSFNLAEADKRNKFVKQIESVLPLENEEKTEIQRELLGLAEIADCLSGLTSLETKSDEVIQTSFQVLKDGRIIEQIRGGFAVYDSNTNEHCILDSVIDSDGTTYMLDDDELLTKEGGLFLADELTEYFDEQSLDADIEAYLQRYADVSHLHRKMTAKYIRFTYLYDKTYELPYVTATGEGGNGKTRLGRLIVMASRRGWVAINPSASSLFRTIDKYHPVCFLDELNLDVSSEDTAAIIQVLNAGAMRGSNVSRVAKVGDKFQTEMFDPYCPKIIGSLKKSASRALNTRCIEIEMEATKRNDIPFRTSPQMLEEARTLRNKLTLYRLRNFSVDFESKLDNAENEMKAARLKPRTIQVNTPLLALTDDAELKEDFIKLLQDADNIRAQDKLETLDGEIVQAIHELIFHCDDAGKETIIYFEHGKLCQDLRIESILEIINADLKEKDKIDGKRLGKFLKGLKLSTKKIKIQGKYRDKTALIFDCEQLQKLFISFALTPFPENSCPQCPQSSKPNMDNDLRGAKENYKENPIAPNNTNGYNTYSNGANGAKENQETGTGTTKTTTIPPIVIVTNNGKREVIEI